MIKRNFMLLAFSLVVGLLSAQTLKSPNGQLEAFFSLDAAGAPVYELHYKGSPVIKPSKMGFELMGNAQEEFNSEIKKENNHETSLYDGFHVVDIKRSVFDETWQPVWGETASIRNHYNEMAVALNQKDTERNMVIRFRLFDDGLGFRYEFPVENSLVYFIVKEELTQFAMTGDHIAWWISGDYDTQEYDYTTSRLSEIRGVNEAGRQGNLSQTGFSNTGVQ
ncbi:MAG: glycoside hydrolase family 97 protein, partial [Tissierellia bacterium]|nr:glycoside hydrolase family 97 protein [Tissierellia bacterium]